MNVVIVDDDQLVALSLKTILEADARGVVDASVSINTSDANTGVGIAAKRQPCAEG